MVYHVLNRANGRLRLFHKERPKGTTHLVRIRTIAAENHPEFLKEPDRIADSGMCRHDGKEAKRMGRDATGRRQGRVSGLGGDSPANPTTVKVTLHLT
jgi:hypothetical protein